MTAPACRKYVKPGRSGLTQQQRMDRWTPQGLPAGQCWEWAGPRSVAGYAQISVKMADRWRLRNVSRLILGLRDGDPRVARHKCDNPPCVNPAHLVVGTYKDNTGDCYERGRASMGEKHSTIGLTDDVVRAIRADTRTLHEIAADHGLTDITVGMIRRGPVWKHLPPAAEPTARRRPRPPLSPAEQQQIAISDDSVADLAARFDRSARVIYRIRREHRRAGQGIAS